MGFCTKFGRNFPKILSSDFGIFLPFWSSLSLLSTVGFLGKSWICNSNKVRPKSLGVSKLQFRPISASSLSYFGPHFPDFFSYLERTQAPLQTMERTGKLSADNSEIIAIEFRKNFSKFNVPGTPQRGHSPNLTPPRYSGGGADKYSFWMARIGPYLVEIWGFENGQNLAFLAYFGLDYLGTLSRYSRPVWLFRQLCSTIRKAENLTQIGWKLTE